MKLWCLTSGEYSDYGIVGIFSSLDKIKEYIEYSNRITINYYKEQYPEESDEELLLHKWSSFHTPFEIEVDDFISSNDKFPYRIYMCKNGDTTSIYTEDDIHIDEYFFNKHKNSNNIWDIGFVINAKDKEHAIKIANERRVQLIANGEL